MLMRDLFAVVNVDTFCFYMMRLTPQLVAVEGLVSRSDFRKVRDQLQSDLED